MSSDGTETECCVSAVHVLKIRVACQLMEQKLNAVSLLFTL